MMATEREKAKKWTVSKEEMNLLLEMARSGTLHASEESQNPYKYPKTFTMKSLRKPLACEGGNEEMVSRYTRAYEEGLQVDKGDGSGAGIFSLWPAVTTRIDQTLREVLSSRSALRSVILKRVVLEGGKQGNIDEIFSEIVTGYFLNTLVLKRLTPGFVLLVDWFRAPTDPEAANKVCETAPARGRKKQITYNMQYIISERADQTIDAFIKTHPSLDHIRACLLQVAHLLDVGWRTRRFVHQDLHGKNVMVTRPLAQERGINDAWLMTADARTKAYDVWYALRNNNNKETSTTESAETTTEETSADGDEARPLYFKLPNNVTDGGRIAKLIDFGRSRIRTSSDPNDPMAVDRIIPEEDLGFANLGIVRDNPSPFYDLRRLVYDIVTNILPNKQWTTIKEEASTENWSNWLEFCKRAMDVSYMTVFLKKHKQQILNIDGVLYGEVLDSFGDEAILSRDQEEEIKKKLATRDNTWYDILHKSDKKKATSQEITRVLENLFTLDNEDEAGKYIYSILLVHCIWRNDPRNEVDDEFEQLAEYHNDDWNESLELRPHGLTPRDALENDFFKLLRVTYEEARQVMQLHKGSELLMPANLLNLTLAEAGVSEILKEGDNGDNASNLETSAVQAPFIGHPQWAISTSTSSSPSPSSSSYSSSLSPSSSLFACHYCSLPVVREACAACRRTFYCSTRCARAAWYDPARPHAAECPRL